jgi:hypothetical protein
MNLDIGKAFSYVFEDPKWVTKVLIGGGLILGGIITLIGWIFTGPVVLGYAVQTLRNVYAGNPQPLPEWDNWGERWIDGLKAWVVTLIMAIPTILVSLVFQVPANILNATSDSGVSGAGTALSLLGGCLNFFLGIVIALLVPIAVARYATTNSIGNAVQFGEIFAMLRQNIGMYVVVALLSTFAVGLISFLGIIACFVGVFFTAFYGTLVQYNLYAQAYRQATGGMQPAYGSPYGNPPYGGGPGPYGGQRPF